MRIVYVIEKLSGTGGLQRILTDKINYLAEHTAHEVVLITIWHNTNPLSYKISEKVRRVNLNVPLLNIPGGYILTLPLALYRFNQYIKKISPDIAVFFRAMGAFLIFASNWKGKKVFESHLDYSHSNHKWLYPFMQRKADAVVCLTKDDAKKFDKARQTIVIPNFTTIVPVSTPNYNAKQCLWVGRLEPEKAPERLLNIWTYIKEMHPDWRLDVYGDGSLKYKLSKSIEKLKLNDAITLRGVTNNMAEAYSKYSFLLMTSKFEGLPMTLIEANTCGLPAIAFDCPHGPRTIIKDKETGFLIPIDDDKAMIHAIDEMISQEAMRRTMGQQSKEAAKIFTPAGIISMWLKLFSSLQTI